MTAREDRENQAGLTLVEVAVVTLLLGILAAIAVPVYLAQRDRAQDAAVRSDLRNAKVLLEAYELAHDRYDASALSAERFARSPHVSLDTGGIADGNYCVAGRYDARDRWFVIRAGAGAIDGPYDSEPC